MDHVQHHHGRKLAQSGSHPSKSRDEWVAHFPCMLRYAATRVGKTDAREVATEALWNAYQSKRERPSTNDPAACCEWLMYFVYWAGRSFQTRQSNEKKTAILLEEAKHVFLDSYVPSHSEAVLSRLTLAKALEVLSPEEKTLLCATYVLEYSSREVARARGMNKRTLQRLIASLTEKARQQIKDVRHGMTIFLPIRDIRSVMRTFFDSASRRLVRASRAMQHFAWCSVSVIMGGVFPGGTSFEVPLENPLREPSPGVTSNSPPTEPQSTANSRKWSPALEPLPTLIKTSIVEEKRTVSRSSRIVAAGNPHAFHHAPVAIDKPAAASEVFSDAMHVPPLAASAASVVNAAPSVEPATRRVRSSNANQACFNAFSEAQAAFNHHDDAETCLAYLNHKPDGILCPETDYRQTLRTRCAQDL